MVFALCEVKDVLCLIVASTVRFAGLLLLSTMEQFLCRTEQSCVSKFLYECLDVMLGADSENYSQTSDQPKFKWLGKG